MDHRSCASSGLGPQVAADRIRVAAKVSGSNPSVCTSGIPVRGGVRACISGTDQERYFLLVVDDYSRYTTVFPLRSKADVTGVLILWICATRLKLREQVGGAAGAAGAGGATGGAGTGGDVAAGARGAGGAGGAASTGGAGAEGTGGTGAAGGMALRQVLSLPSSTGLTPPLLCSPTDQSLPQLLPSSPLPAPTPHTEVTEPLTKHREPETRASTLVRARRVARPRPPAIPGTHGMALLPSLVNESQSVCPLHVLGEPALGSDVLEDGQFELECLSAVLPRFASMVLCPKGDSDALEIPTLRSYAEAIAGEYSSQWQTAMDTEMASWKSTSTYVDEVPPPGTNIVDGMWIFRVKRALGSSPAFKAHYVARRFTLRDYELHSLDFSTAFLQGSLHEEIWLRRPPGFTRSFSAGTQWSLCWPVYGLRQAPREWHDTLRTTLAALGFAPSSVDPSVFLCTDTTLPPFSVLVYVDDLVFATADTEALTLVKAGLQERHICIDLGKLRNYLGLHITRDRARCTITLTLSHMVHQVLQRFGFQYSSSQPSPLPTDHSL
ncbi:unnamed protein product [Closterium sp. NIES-53]